MKLYKKIIKKKEIVGQTEGKKGRMDRLMGMGVSEVS